MGGLKFGVRMYVSALSEGEVRAGISAEIFQITSYLPQLLSNEKDDSCTSLQQQILLFNLSLHIYISLSLLAFIPIWGRLS